MILALGEPVKDSAERRFSDQPSGTAYLSLGLGLGLVCGLQTQLL
jgi:hypothetical protein